MISFFTNNLIWTQGVYILVTILVGSIIGLTYSRVLSVFSFALLVFTLFFFRNPDRICPIGDSLIISPADGTVVAITQLKDDPSGFTQLVSIFLSPFDVHVNRAPFTGQVDAIAYSPGAFTMAFLPKSSALNEHNDVLFSDQHGRTVLVRQIAGFIARRICCWVSKGQTVRCGELFGMIKFGSRVDIFLPPEVRIRVAQGQRVWGGQTILGNWI